MFSGKRVIVSSIVMWLTVAISGCALIQKVEVKPPEKAYRIKLNALTKLEKFQDKINTDLRITVGSFSDRTGQFRDLDRQRYSKVLTQAGDLVLYHILYKALGPRILVEREAPNWKQITEEYRSSYTKNGIRTGLITKDGPEGGLVGAQYMVTGAIVFYHADRYSGGGGLNIDGIGGSVKVSAATVGIELRLVNISTSEVYWSTLLESWVTGMRVGADLFRFIDAFGGDYLVQAEAGFAYQLPADIAFQTCLATAVTEMIEENKSIFLAAYVK
jgi:curli biogenesis system outer membrane secretion channel CsgG